MKLHVTRMLIALILTGTMAFAKKTELYESNYFIFQSNQQLNAHLFLYNKAISCKFARTPDDSLAPVAFKDKLKGLSANDQAILNAVIRFYRDSLLTKDLLFDSLMRNFSDHLSQGSTSKNRYKAGWQLAALENLKAFQPYFLKLYWPVIDSTNKAWLNANKNQILTLETKIVPELERVYKTKLPGEKIRVDLSSYATWAGAYSYIGIYHHIILSTTYKSNQGDLAAEVIFHETSHFLVDKLADQIVIAAKGKNIKKDINLWHNIIFYTTGYLMDKEYKLKWQKFEPYYVHLKFQDRFPDFKITVDACKLYWDPYLSGNTSFETAVKDMVDYVVEKQ